MAHSYPLLDLTADAAGFAVLSVAARAFHPSIRKDPGLRLARRRFYRQMLAAHAAAAPKGSSASSGT